MQALVLKQNFFTELGSRLFGRPYRSILVQESPLAGFDHHQGNDIWRSLKEGKALRLVRERDNPHDHYATAIYFRNTKLGYVPRKENKMPARFIDEGRSLKASIVRLTDDENPWERVRFRVDMEI